ncbi:ASN_collapsed_G0014240.mRNA.1.CDS.1 [Saccharomyces cerevisiae]|nr:ASN_collapsed_G0014240.mRNA.1.CDS.1 [Saccharomyces cerevisiae]
MTPIIPNDTDIVTVEKQDESIKRRRNFRKEVDPDEEAKTRRTWSGFGTVPPFIHICTRSSG